MAAYTSTQDGDWNVAATWGGGGFPTAADTATINHVVTVPTGVSSTCGVITLTKTLDIVGTFTLAGNISSTVASWVLSITGGGTLDLAGFTITPTAVGAYTFVGTSGDRATVVGGGGYFASMGGSAVTATLEYCDFSGLADSWLGRTQTSAIFQTMRYCTVTDCAYFALDATGVAAGAGFILEYCDFSDWSGANPVSSADYQPDIYQNNAANGATRLIRGCTWDNSMNASGGYWKLQAKEAIVEDCVFIDTKTYSHSVSRDAIYRDNFYSNTKSESPFLNGSGTYLDEFRGNYVYYEQGNHTFTPNGSIVSRWIGNVFDNKDGADGVNWFINPSTGGGSSTLIANNVILGKGNLAVNTTALPLGTIIVRNNTSYVDNAGAMSGSQFFPIWYMTEQATTDASGATVEVYSNFLWDIDDTNTRDPVIDLASGGIADELDVIDYNSGWGDSGAGTPPVEYDDSVIMTGGVAPNDFAVNPLFVDKLRDIKTWDAANGGLGTVANAITELLKINKAGFDSNYTPRNLVRYTQAGFQPQTTGLTAGRFGETVGGAQPYADASLKAAPLNTLQASLLAEIAAI